MAEHKGGNLMLHKRDEDGEPLALPTHLAILTSQQLAFVKAFIQSGNQTQAAKEAGYGGAEGKFAAQRGYELMKIAKVRDAVTTEQLDQGHAMRSRALLVLDSVLNNPSTSESSMKLKLAAAKEIMDRFGLVKSSKSTQVVQHEFDKMPEDELRAFIKAQIIATKIIDITPTEVIEDAQEAIEIPSVEKQLADHSYKLIKGEVDVIDITPDPAPDPSPPADVDPEKKFEF